MAYVTICEPCLEGRHQECDAGREHDLTIEQVQGVDADEVCGGGFCVCGHGEPESDFQKSVRESCERVEENS